MRWLNAHLWVVPSAVLLLAAVIRFSNLGYPADSLIFDEVYYVKDAASQLIFGFPTEWPNDLEYRFGPVELARMSSEASNAVHPPLGKWLIGLGMLIFGSDTALGWRFSVALFGTLTVGVLMLLTYRLVRSVWVASLAGFLLAIEGVSVVMSRVGLLDGFLAFFALTGVLFMVLDHDWVTQRWRQFMRTRSAASGQWGPVFWWRPWLLAATVSFGCASAVKWSGLYFFAAFLAITVLRDVLLRKRLGLRLWAFNGLLRQGLATLLVTVPLYLLTYLASWTGWIVTSDGYNRSWAIDNGVAKSLPWLPDWLPSLMYYHQDMYTWHSTLQAAHPYLAHPLTWPFALRPTSMLFESSLRGEDGCAFTQCAWAITPIPNVLIWWGGVAAIVWLVVWMIRRSLARRNRAHLPPGVAIGAYTAQRFRPRALELDRGALFAVTGFVAGYVPWLITYSRSAVFQFYTVAFAPYLVLALTLVIWRMLATGERLGGETALSRRWIVGVFLGAVALVSAYFLPLWIGLQTSFEFWNLHMWLPGWR